MAASDQKAAPSEPDDEEISAKTGIFLTRRTKYFANADNPRTAAGNREDLVCDAASRTPGPLANRSEYFQAAENAPRIPEWAAGPSTPVDELPLATYTDLEMTAGKGPATKPEPQSSANDIPPNGIQPTLPGVDGPTPARRRLQTLLNVLQSIGHSTRKGGTTLPRATLMVHCQLETLLGLAEPAGITTHGPDISPGQLRRMLCDAGVLPIVFNSQSRILDLGREQRLGPDYMREAVLARDGGCLVPECTVPPEHCEICHIDAWQDGASTSLGNTGPGCSAHHHDFHTGKIKLVRNSDGLLAVLLPKYMDREQLPRRNMHWQQHRRSNPPLF